MWGLKQQWKQVVNSADLITHELTTKELRVRLEARRDEENESWVIFKTYFDTAENASLNFTQEYRTKTLDEAQRLLEHMQKEKLPSKKELYEQKLEHAKKVHINLKRHFKDYNVEKWNFAVNDEAYENAVYVRDADVSDVSIILHERHKPLEANILHELRAILGLDASELDIKQELYYYNTKSDSYQKTKKMGLFLGNFELGMDSQDEK